MPVRMYDWRPKPNRLKWAATVGLEHLRAAASEQRRALTKAGL